MDYRSSGFPVALFNGHLTSSNSDVRAGNNADKRNARCAGLQSWWRGFFGIKFGRAPEADTTPRAAGLSQGAAPARRPST